MRLTIVTGFFLPLPALRGGSTEKIWARLSQEFAARGHQVTVISRAWPGLPTHSRDGNLEHIRLPGWDHDSRLLVNLWHDFLWGIRVSRRLPVADAVICNTVTLPVWLRSCRSAAGKVVVVMARMPKGHGLAYGRVDLVLSLSEAVSARLRSENPRLERRTAAFPYPIDWRLHAEAAAQRPTASCLTIGYIGRIHPEKGLLLLAAAVRILSQDTSLPPWRVQLIGPQEVADGGGGPAFVAALQRAAGSPTTDRLRIQGPEFGVEALARLYAQIDVFCYPSIAEQGETFGVAVAEAMAAGCAPLVSDLPCFRSLVLPGTTGQTFDHRGPDAADQLARALAALLRDSSRRDQLGRTAQAHVKQFDFAASAESVLRSLQGIASA